MLPIVVLFCLAYACLIVGLVLSNRAAHSNKIEGLDYLPDEE